MKQNVIIGLVVLVALLVGYQVLAPKDIQTGSVTVGNEYGYLGASTTPTTTFFKGAGTLGSVVITKVGAAGGTWTLYDSTSTSATLRKTIVTFATDATVGTYVFDINYDSGLELVPSTSMGSTTITYRKQ
jgi:hypothetical protein